MKQPIFLYSDQMFDTVVKKQKIHLPDYDFASDVDNRVFLSHCSPFELQLLEEILFSPLKIPTKKLARNMGCEEGQILPFLEKLSTKKLVSLEGEILCIDKEWRKYFELELERFHPDFCPNMEFLQGLLRKVPIHHLPNWYSLPRSADNIFASIVEKYLATPQLYQRHWSELSWNDPVIPQILEALLKAPTHTLATKDLKDSYALSDAAFEEIVLLLEFHLLATTYFTTENGTATQWLSFFQEWKQYLFLLEASLPPPISASEVTPKEEREYSFLEDLYSSLEDVQRGKSPSEPFLQKLLSLRWIEGQKGRYHLTEEALSWMEGSLASRALALHRHPYNLLLDPSGSGEVFLEKWVKEAEKNLRKIPHTEWISFADFAKKAVVPLQDSLPISLTKAGRSWEYTLPTYSEKELLLLRETLFTWCFELGIVQTGAYPGGECFRLTPLGLSLFHE